MEVGICLILVRQLCLLAWLENNAYSTFLNCLWCFSWYLKLAEDLKQLFGKCLNSILMSKIFASGAMYLRQVNGLGNYWIIFFSQFWCYLKWWLFMWHEIVEVSKTGVTCAVLIYLILKYFLHSVSSKLYFRVVFWSVVQVLLTGLL